MKDLTLTQEYLLCTINEKGELSSDSQETIGLVVSSLIELLYQNFIKIEANKVIIENELTSDYDHLASVYEFIKANKPKDIKTIGQNLWFSVKYVKVLFEDVKKSLADNDCLIEKEVKAMFKTHTKMVAKENSIDAVIQKIRAEILENGELDDNTIALISLLYKTEALKKYFSKYEAKQLKERLKQIKKDPKYKLIMEMIDNIFLLFIVIIMPEG